MRIPDFKRYRGGMQAIAFFVCGMIVGAAIYNAMILDQTSRIMTQNYEIKEQLNLAEKQLQANRQISIIRSIVIFVKSPDHKPALEAVVQVELKKALENDLSILKGRSIYEIGSDAPLVRKLLEGKIYTNIGDDENYAVQIKTMLVADSVLQVWAEAEPKLRK